MKPVASKRASQPRKADYSKAFYKDWEVLERTGRFDMRRLKEVILLLIGNDEPLGPEWRDHPLKGKWAGRRECHIGGDFLLIYQVREERGRAVEVLFQRAGTHAELFRE